ncbi:MAG: hypothetical protein HC850_16620 [Rhodomicrobium sp.]|nr:hypothetical protein [Rhodomicrobium sp.]
MQLNDGRLSRLDPALADLRARLADTRIGLADAAVKDASETLSTMGEEHAALVPAAQENLNLAEARREKANRESILERAIASTRQQSGDVQQSAETVERILATGALTEELGAVLRSVQTSLPAASQLMQQLVDNEKARVSLQLNQILWQERLRTLGDTEAAVRTLLALDDDAALESDVFEPAAALIETRRALLNGLIEDARSEADQIAAQEIAIRDLLIHTERLSALLDRRLLCFALATRLPERGLQPCPPVSPG